MFNYIHIFTFTLPFKAGIFYKNERKTLNCQAGALKYIKSDL